MTATRALVPTPCRGCGSRYGVTAARAIADRVGSAADPRRQWIAAAAELGRLVAGGQVEEDFAETLVLDLADAIGRDTSEAHKAWRWALRAGQRSPRTPSPTRRVTTHTVVEDVLAWWDQIATDPTLTEARSGATARKVLSGVALVAINAHRIEVGMSYRQLAEAGGLSLATVKRTRALWGRHLVVARPADRRRGQRTVWRLRFSTTDGAHSDPNAGGRGHGHSPNGLRMRAPSSGDVGLPGGNAWHRCSGCWATWSALDVTEPATPKDIAPAIGRHPGTVRKTLRRLAADGLVIEVAGGWVRVPDAAEPEGPDFAAARRARHEIERSHYRYGLRMRVAEEENR